MLLFSVASIFLRFFNISFLWIEPFVRHLVFISIFLGGILATGKGSHIGIDILAKYFESSKNEKARRYLNSFISLFSCVILFWMAYASLKFVEVELEYGKEVFWGVHSGFLVMIIPIGFVLISFRFIIQFVRNLFDIKVEVDA